MLISLLYLMTNALKEAPLLVPLGVLGVWRWSAWLAKRTLAAFYQPIENNYQCTATVVTAVFNEDPALFKRAISSWLDAGAERIVVVIQGSGQRCSEIAAAFKEVEIVTLSRPDKREALAAGVDCCRSDIVVLADSDVIWEPDVLAKMMMPFVDPKIGGVGTRQNMCPTNGEATVWERLADIFLDCRYSDEVPATARWGQAISCLSGRTAAYRTKLLQRCRDQFINETFNGTRCISGDDKRYTQLVLLHGFRTWSQLNARVYSTFQPSLPGFVRQRIRWFRNTYRSDFKSLRSDWLWKRSPLLGLVMLDKAIAPFAQIFGFSIFIYSTSIGLWEIVAIQAVWWHASRAVKILPHLRRRPESVWLLSVFIFASIMSAFIKVYSLATLNTQGWLTRDKSPPA